MNRAISYQAPDVNELKHRLNLVLSWLDNSFKVNNYNGSSAYRHSLGFWGPPYPETTGYLIPTLLDAGAYLSENKWPEIARKQLDYFFSLQNKDGSFPVNENNPVPNVFDSAQILQGLVSYSQKNNDTRCEAMLGKLYVWLEAQIDEWGRISRYNLSADYNPAYYMRIVWPLLQALEFFGEKPPPKLHRLYTHLTYLFLENKIQNAAFAPGEPAYSHTLAYALRGYFESAKIFHDGRGLSFVNGYCISLARKIRKNKSLAGAITENGEEDYSFVCTTGNIQISLLFLMLSNETDPDIHEALELLLTPVFKSQRQYLWNCGAVPSSIPVYGPYQRLKYTNWTQKFYVDLLLTLLKV